MSNPGGQRKLLGVAVLAGGVLAVGGVAVYLAMSGAGGASAGAGGPAAATAAVGQPGTDAATLETSLSAANDLIGKGRFEDAAQILAKLVDAHPMDMELRRSFAQSLMGIKKSKEAYEQFVAAISLLPAGTTDRISKGSDPAAGQLHFEAGTCASTAGLWDRADEHYSMAQTANPKEPKYPLYLAMVQIRKGDDAAATASLLRAAHLNPDLAEAWGTLGELALKGNSIGLAQQHIEKARKLQPDSLKWRVVEARLLNRRGEAEQAATLLLALDESRRYEPGVVTALCESYGLLKKPEEAAKFCERAFEASGRGEKAAARGEKGGADAGLAYQAAVWWQRAGKKEEAIKAARAAAMLGNEDARELAEKLENMRG